MTTADAANRLLTHQRAELERAESLRRQSLWLQFLVALSAAISVFTDAGGQLLALAIVGAVLLTFWLVADFYYRRHRGAGDQARRLLLITNGIGEEVGERHNITGCFTAPIDKVSDQSIGIYFASTAPPGMLRLGEMLDESAFFTADLHRRSAERMYLATLFGTIIVIVLTMIFAPQLDPDHRVVVARVFLAFFVLVLSSDILGAAFAHHRAYSAMDAIRLRLSAARRCRYLPGDVLQAMADYNAAVEGAPLPLPGLYRARRAALDAAWADYKADTGIGGGGSE